MGLSLWRVLEVNTMDTLEVQVARLQERVGTLQTDVTDIRSDQKAQNGKLDQLLDAHQQRKGAQRFAKTLVNIGSGSGVVALIAWVVEHLRP